MKTLFPKLIVCCFLLSFCVVMPLAAAEVEIFRANTAEVLAEGTLDGVSVTPRGHLNLARQVTRLAGLDEPFIFSAAGHADGWVVGTGSEGKVLLVKADGSVETLATLPEPQVFAVAVDSAGTIYGATSPDGKVYRIADGAAEVVFDPDATYIWDLDFDAKGNLLVATGLDASLFRVPPSGKAKAIYTSRDVHLRSLLVTRDGRILVGTAGQGLVLEISEQGKASTLFDAVHPEVVALTEGADGEVFAAVLASEASRVDLSAGTTQTSAKAASDEEVTVVVNADATLGSRSGGFKGARSVVVALHPAKQHREVAALASETVHSLLFADGELWIGSGEEGKLYRRQGDGVVEERELEERQIVAMAQGPKGVVAVTANASAVYALKAQPVTEGTYVSKVLDTEQVARFGSFQWQGEAPSGTSIGLDFRSGLSQAPDATWSDWQSIDCKNEGCDAAGRRREISLGALPNGRFIQWRAQLEGSKGLSPRLEGVELSYRQENRRPKISKLEVLDPGKILVPSTFNPQSQAYEPWSPNREGIFTSLTEAGDEDESRLKTLWKKGYRTLRWKAEDANEDSLNYRLDFRPQSSAEDAWMPMAKALDDSHYSFDSTVLPDGIYHFRLTASDHQDRSTDEALDDRQETAPVVIDHSAAEWVSARRVDGGIEVTVRDRLSPLRQAVFSLDAGDWQTTGVGDGLLDGRRETVRLKFEGVPRILLLRVTDASHNVVTFNVLPKL